MSLIFLLVLLIVLYRFTDAWIGNRVKMTACRVKFPAPITITMGYGKNPRYDRGSNGVGKYVRGGRDNSIRQSRVARTVKIELADIIGECDIKARSYPDEDLLRGTTVADVDISPDLSYAKVFVTVLGNAVERRQVYVWLCENAGQVRYSLARRLRHMKKIPDIYFKLADSQATSDLVSLIDELSDEMRATKENKDDDKFEFEEDDGD
jgi:ribosome-binding factor A